MLMSAETRGASVFSATPSDGKNNGAASDRDTTIEVDDIPIEKADAAAGHQYEII
jgi:hypothetical protein